MPESCVNSAKNSHLCLVSIKVQMKFFFIIAEFERAAKIRKIAFYRFLISLSVSELLRKNRYVIAHQQLVRTQVKLFREEVDRHLQLLMLKN